MDRTISYKLRRPQYGKNAKEGSSGSKIHRFLSRKRQKSKNQFFSVFDEKSKQKRPKEDKASSIKEYIKRITLRDAERSEFSQKFENQNSSNELCNSGIPTPLATESIDLVGNLARKVDIYLNKNPEKQNSKKMKKKKSHQKMRTTASTLTMREGRLKKSSSSMQPYMLESPRLARNQKTAKKKNQPNLKQNLTKSSISGQPRHPGHYQSKKNRLRQDWKALEQKLLNLTKKRGSRHTDTTMEVIAQQPESNHASTQAKSELLERAQQNFSFSTNFNKKIFVKNFEKIKESGYNEPSVRSFHGHKRVRNRVGSPQNMGKSNSVKSAKFLNGASVDQIRYFRRQRGDAGQGGATEKVDSEHQSGSASSSPNYSVLKNYASSLQNTPTVRFAGEKELFSNHKKRPKIANLAKNGLGGSGVEYYEIGLNKGFEVDRGFEEAIGERGEEVFNIMDGKNGVKQLGLADLNFSEIGPSWPPDLPNSAYRPSFNHPGLLEAAKDPARRPTPKKFDLEASFQNLVKNAKNGLKTSIKGMNRHRRDLNRTKDLPYTPESHQKLGSDWQHPRDHQEAELTSKRHKAPKTSRNRSNHANLGPKTPNQFTQNNQTKIPENPEISIDEEICKFSDTLSNIFNVSESVISNFRGLLLRHTRSSQSRNSELKQRNLTLISVINSLDQRLGSIETKLRHSEKRESRLRAQLEDIRLQSLGLEKELQSSKQQAEQADAKVKQMDEKFRAISNENEAFLKLLNSVNQEDRVLTREEIRDIIVAEKQQRGSVERERELLGECREGLRASGGLGLSQVGVRKSVVMKQIYDQENVSLGVW